MSASVEQHQVAVKDRGLERDGRAPMTFKVSINGFKAAPERAARPAS